MISLRLFNASPIKFGNAHSTTTEPIRFYKRSEAYGDFSNFSRHPIVLDGKEWPTSEHYFQAQKFITTEPDYAEAIRRAEDPMTAATMGRDRAHQCRSDWDQVKDDVMRKAVHKKFESNHALAQLLRSTGTAPIIEATTNDYYWGEGTNKTGKNMLGVILMEVREALRS